MAIPDGFLYEYAVVRYVPRVEREEFINIGLIMMCKRRKWLRGEIRWRPERLVAFDPNVNIEILKRQSSVFMRDDIPSKLIPVEERYRWLTAVKSAVLQVSPSHPGIIPESRVESETESDIIRVLNIEFDRLLSEFVN